MGEVGDLTDAEGAGEALDAAAGLDAAVAEAVLTDSKTSVLLITLSVRLSTQMFIMKTCFRAADTSILPLGGL